MWCIHHMRTTFLFLISLLSKLTMKLAPVRHAQFVCYDCECYCHVNLLLWCIACTVCLLWLWVLLSWHPVAGGVLHSQFVCYDCECYCHVNPLLWYVACTFSCYNCECFGHDNMLLVVCCMHSLCVTTVSIIVMTTCCSWCCSCAAWRRTRRRWCRALGPSTQTPARPSSSISRKAATPSTWKHM